MIPRSWYRAQKPLKPGNTKKIRKDYEIPTPGRAPKIRKKYRKNTKTVILGPFSYFFSIFFVFSGPDPGWGFRKIFVFFSYFFRISGLERFLGSIPGTRNHNTKEYCYKIFEQFSDLWHTPSPGVYNDEEPLLIQPMRK